jgi:hypothetical protein
MHGRSGRWLSEINIGGACLSAPAGALTHLNADAP